MSSEDVQQRILLLQARQPGDPILDHEYDCFVERMSQPEDTLHAVNMATDGIDPSLLDGFDVVTVGGAGDFSIVEGGFDWFDDLYATMRAVIDRSMPMFGSCFGLQAIVRALGGRLERDSDRSEIGTFEIELTEAGRRDPFFSQLPKAFDAQLGHKDSVVELPDELVRLARSERCEVQAVRVPGRPIYATQFHPELTARDNIERYARYIESYKGLDESREEALERAREIHRPSPTAARLLEQFLDHMPAELSAARASK